MPKTSQRIHIFDFPHASLLFDAYLESVREERRPADAQPTGDHAERSHGSALIAIDKAAITSATLRRSAKRKGAGVTPPPVGERYDIVLDFYAFESTAPSRHYVIGSQPYEQVTGVYRPYRLRFTQAQWLRRSGVFTDLATFAETPGEHEARRLMGALHASTPADGEFFIISNASPEYMLFSLRAGGYQVEERDGAAIPAQYLRRWAFTPPTPAGPLPDRPALYRRFAGDAVVIHLGKRAYRRRLFIGGVIMQGPERPAVDHVLNLCPEPNPWLVNDITYPGDRFSCKGEMALGMRLDDLREEAEWVIERLRTGRTVLVHCYAGINRSATVCCAALILLEGLSAEQALARVRESRPGVQPDPYHWFLLLRLAAQQRGEQPLPYPTTLFVSAPESAGAAQSAEPDERGGATNPAANTAANTEIGGLAGAPSGAADMLANGATPQSDVRDAEDDPTLSASLPERRDRSA